LSGPFELFDRQHELTFGAHYGAPRNLTASVTWKWARADEKEFAFAEVRFKPRLIQRGGASGKGFPQAGGATVLPAAPRCSS